MLRLLVLVGLSWGAPQSLDQDSLDTIQEIFGTAAERTGGYGDSSAAQQAREDPNIDVLVQIVKEASEYPSDYVAPQSENQVLDKATVEVDSQFENCADYTDLLGYECVPYYQCHNGTIITDGAGLIDIRNGFGALSPEDSKCPGFLDVCCKDPDFVPPPPPQIKYSPKCGRRNQNGLGARIQGFTESESQFGEWPHMCAVLHSKPVETEGYTETGEQETVNLYQCGGSLVAPGVILTAAHCVEKFRQSAGELKIRCGEWDTQQQSEPQAHQDRQVATMTIHPEFDGRNLQNDFAVLFLTEDFQLASHIDTACLPQPGELFDGDSCFATGWGKDRFGSAGEYQVVLKEIELGVVSNPVCQDKLRATRLGGKYKLHDSFLCAGGEAGKDTCKGDGGSPLVCPSKADPQTYVQAGIVAWGIGCGEDGTPGVYASVGQAACWIDQAMTCHYGGQTGDYSSYNGYTSAACQTWLDTKLASLETKRQAAGKFARIFEAQIAAFQQCSVVWEQEAAPLIATLARDENDESYAPEPQLITDGGEGYGQPEPQLVKTDGSGDGYTQPDCCAAVRCDGTCRCDAAGQPECVAAVKAVCGTGQGACCAGSNIGCPAEAPVCSEYGYCQCAAYLPGGPECGPGFGPGAALSQPQTDGAGYQEPKTASSEAPPAKLVEESYSEAAGGDLSDSYNQYERKAGQAEKLVEQQTGAY